MKTESDPSSPGELSIYATKVRFPETLMLMLRYAQEEIEPKLEPLQDCCLSWLEDGKSFVIRNEQEFTKTILSRYYPGTLFPSFVRNLYRWGFQQISKTKRVFPREHLAFCHTHFHKDNPDFMMHMTSKAGANRAAEYRSIVSLLQCESSVQGKLTSLTNNKKRKVEVLRHGLQPPVAQQRNSTRTPTNVSIHQPPTPSKLLALGLLQENKPGNQHVFPISERSLGRACLSHYYLCDQTQPGTSSDPKTSSIQRSLMTTVKDLHSSTHLLTELTRPAVSSFLNESQTFKGPIGNAPIGDPPIGGSCMLDVLFSPAVQATTSILQQEDNLATALHASFTQLLGPRAGKFLFDTRMEVRNLALLSLIDPVLGSKLRLSSPLAQQNGLESNIRLPDVISSHEMEDRVALEWERSPSYGLRRENHQVPIPAKGSSSFQQLPDVIGSTAFGDRVTRSNGHTPGASSDP
mmetsp:Transcript_11811/g.18006  ORF Transcript_11811/g.18006 Transcript_11811/m.18006 type:complete len:463 (+) Transcript_11811:122-1510(+)